MARRAVSADVHALTEEVRELRSDLWTVRYSMLQLMRPELEALLTSFFSLKATDKPYRWADELVEKLLDHAKPRPSREMGGVSSSSDRALCPLCGGGSDNPHGEEGFAFPEGLRRHLSGSYNARQCVITKAAIDLAWDHVREKATTPIVNL
jgi:hypothetical protein